MSPQKPDPEMLKELDVLLNLDTLEDESDWETMEDLEAVESEDVDE